MFVLRRPRTMAIPFFSSARSMRGCVGARAYAAEQAPPPDSTATKPDQQAPPAAPTAEEQIATLTARTAGSPLALDA
jgi:hypothetical protein